MVENLFRDLDRLGRFFSQGELTFRQVRREARAAKEFLYEPASLPCFAELCCPKGLSNLVQCRFPGKDLVKKVNSIIKVIPLQGFAAFGEYHTQIAWHFVQAFFCHTFQV